MTTTNYLRFINCAHESVMYKQEEAGPTQQKESNVGLFIYQSSRDKPKSDNGTNAISGNYCNVKNIRLYKRNIEDALAVSCYCLFSLL